MKTVSVIRTLPRAFFAAAALSLTAFAQAQFYTVVDLGASSSGETSGGSAINASGQVAGFFSVAGGGSRAALWTGDTPLDLGTLGGTYGYALSLNAAGTIVGSSYLPGDQALHAFVYDFSGRRDLGTLGGKNSAAVGINSIGQIVGNADLPNEAGSHAALWTGATIKDLGTFGGFYSYAYGINDSGQICGVASTASGANHAARWTGGIAEDLDALSRNSSGGLGINGAGQIAGYASVANFHTHATRWTGKVAEDLGTLYGGNSFGNAINRYGAVVGDIRVDFGGQYAFLYTSGQMQDLNTLVSADSGWTLTSASGINDSGWITGTGRYNGETHAYLLKPAASSGLSRIALEGVTNLSLISPAAPLGTFHISVRAPGSTTELYSNDISLAVTGGSGFGAYTLTGVPNGQYDVAIKGNKSLQVVIKGFNINGVDALPDVQLPAGDANNDNSVDSTDFTALIGAFSSDATIPGSGYDPTADFNYDGFVDSSDFTLLIGQFNNTGEK